MREAELYNETAKAYMLLGKTNKIDDVLILMDIIPYAH